MDRTDPGQRTILHVTESFGAGVQNAISQYAENFPGKHTVLARRRPEDVAVDLRAHLIQVHSIPALWRAVSAHAKDADIVHAHSSIAGGLLRLRGRKIRAKLVYSPHALAYLGSRGRFANSLIRAVEKALIGRTQAFGAVSNHESQEFKLLGAPPSAVVVIPHAVTPVGSPSPREARKQEVVAIGRVVPQKDPQFLTALKRRGLAGGMAWTWIGEGDAALESALVSAGIEVTGWIAAGSAWAKTCEALAVVHTARYEGLPIALVEALAAGTPVLARSIPAIDELPVIKCSTDEEWAAAFSAIADATTWSNQQEAGLDYVRRTHSASAQRHALTQLYSLVQAISVQSHSERLGES